MTNLDEQLTPETLEWAKSTSLAERKKLGQYMTPKFVRDILFEHLPLKNGDKIVDPSVGTGEFLRAIASTKGLEDCQLYGWDVDEHILSVAKKVVPTANLSIHSLYDSNIAFLNKFDVVIGNPPYFETTLSTLDKQLFTTVNGRANVYGLFFERYLPILKDGGYLAFIVPPSMNAGAYFSKLREYIMEHAEIKFIKIIRSNTQFSDALTSAQAIVIQKTSKVQKNNDFIVDFSSFISNAALPIIFSDNKKLILDTFTDKKSLADLGYRVITGSISWDQYKGYLMDTHVPGSVVLYHAKDITTSNELVLNDKLKDKRYLQTTKPPLVGEALLVNRIVGSLDNPKLKIAKVDNPAGFFAENHVNVIIPNDKVEQLITLDELRERLLSISGLSEYLKALTGNTQLSARELMYLLPV
jgi:adenine-specific DNA-methyltransferase